MWAGQGGGGVVTWRERPGGCGAESVWVGVEGEIWARLCVLYTLGLVANGSIDGYEIYKPEG